MCGFIYHASEVHSIVLPSLAFLATARKCDNEIIVKLNGEMVIRTRMDLISLSFTPGLKNNYSIRNHTPRSNHPCLLPVVIATSHGLITKFCILLRIAASDDRYIHRKRGSTSKHACRKLDYKCCLIFIGILQGGWKA